ncbi:MAG: hypothetical protein QXS42_03225 [Zestosphaera sp.]
MSDLKGQSDLISAVVLVSVVLVASVSFLSYASSLLAQRTAESDLNNFLQKEVANTVIYKEGVVKSSATPPGTLTVYLGVVRVDSTATTYYYLALNNTYCNMNGVIGGGDFLQVQGGLSVPSSRVYILLTDGQHLPLDTFTPYRSSATTVNLGVLPHRGGNELLMVNFTKTERKSPPANPNCWVVILFVQAGNNYYEVGRYYEVKS